MRSCISADAENTAIFLTEELKKKDQSPVWIDAIVRASEVVRFDGLHQQHDVGRSLLRIASSLKVERRCEAPHTVYCALHRGGSLIPADEVGHFEPFLEYRGGVDTRLAALQAIVHIFEIEKDVPRQAYESVLKRVIGLTAKYLDPDVLMPGEVGAIAIEGLVALRLMDIQLFKRIENERPASPRWFESLLKRRIQELDSRQTQVAVS